MAQSIRIVEYLARYGKFFPGRKPREIDGRRVNTRTAHALTRNGLFCFYVPEQDILARANLNCNPDSETPAYLVEGQRRAIEAMKQAAQELKDMEMQALLEQTQPDKTGFFKRIQNFFRLLKQAIADQQVTVREAENQAQNMIMILPSFHYSVMTAISGLFFGLLYQSRRELFDYLGDSKIQGHYNSMGYQMAFMGITMFIHFFAALNSMFNNEKVRQQVGAVLRKANEILEQDSSSEPKERP